jgi:hypothetical protein
LEEKVKGAEGKRGRGKDERKERDRGSREIERSCEAISHPI